VDRVFLLVFFEDIEESPLSKASFDLKESLHRIADLEEELRASKMRLKAAIEELEASTRNCKPQTRSCRRLMRNSRAPTRNRNGERGAANPQ
jgi:uncharacterized membrane protein YccC